MSEPTIEIDSDSGFCFGVTTAINKAEEELRRGGQLFCLGDIVHNDQECQRLQLLGLNTVSHSDLHTLAGQRLLLRAHGEPPSTYRLCQDHGIQLIDATCPVVLNLQRKIRNEYLSEPTRQIVIYGKRGHAEVIGLVGQTDGQAIVVEQEEDLKLVDFTKPVSLYSQTTKSVSGFRELVEAALQRARMVGGPEPRHFDTICRQVHGRTARLRAFAMKHDALLFVSGRKSSNGQALLKICREVNPHTYHVEAPEEIRLEWFAGAKSIGICGATSTPKWLMEQCKLRVKSEK